MSKKNKRRNLMDLEPSPTEPDPVVQAIVAPEAGAHLRKRRAKRNRKWEKDHPVLRCWVPVHVREKAREVQAAIKGLAENLSEEDKGFFTTTGEVARVFLEFSWKDIERGRLSLTPRPNPKGRKMRLEWEEVGEGWQKVKRAPRSKGTKSGKGNMWLGYRMTPDNVRLWQQRIQTVAQQYNLTPGEVLVRLLSHGLAAYESGRLVLRKTPVVTQWQISGRISRKNRW